MVDLFGVFKVDVVWGLFVFVLIVMGFVCVFGGFEKGIVYYLYELFFYLKMIVFVLILLFEIVLMLGLICWCIVVWW